MKRMIIWLLIILVVILLILAGIFVYQDTQTEWTFKEIQATDSEDAIANRGFDLLIAKKPKEALIYLDKAYPLADNDRQKASILGGKATAYELLNQPEESLKCYDLTIKSVRGDEESLVLAYICKAYLLEKLGRLKEAKETARQVINLDVYGPLRDQIDLLKKKLEI